ncbi:hypothetical protein EHS25_007321 [Saitozyma podzolica]|uniref:Transcription factor domain-containing protein n=1 Tax=Saitozyma podzolica TaxID=1890683 RepID=A0A427XMH0_9TREE|nr:hypothetical protein EHS25_007321 [Saitozyma podzolica]
MESQFAMMTEAMRSLERRLIAPLPQSQPPPPPPQPMLEPGSSAQRSFSSTSVSPSFVLAPDPPAGIRSVPAQYAATGEDNVNGDLGPDPRAAPLAKSTSRAGGEGTDDSPLPLDKHFLNQLRDPLFAAAVGQPSRLQYPDLHGFGLSAEGIRMRGSFDAVESGSTGRTCLTRGAGVSETVPVVANQHGALPLVPPVSPVPPPPACDPVDLGLCSEHEAERLHRLFFEKSHLFMPVYDPIQDTFPSLRRRSPISITAILLAAKLAEDGGNDPSPLQRKLYQQAELLGESHPASLAELIEQSCGHFSTPSRGSRPCKRLVGGAHGRCRRRADTCSAILACWVDSGWKLGALAVSISMDMEIHSCLSWLDQRGMGKGKKLDQVESERPAVIGARLWLGLLKLRYEFAFSLGRPLVQDADELLGLSRRFVEHPLANLGDCRLVVACEYLRARFPLFRPYGVREARMENEMDELIRLALNEVQALFAHWESFYVSCGVPVEHTVRGILVAEHAHAALHTAARVLPVVRYDADLSHLPDEKREWLRIALVAAQQLVHQCLREPLGQLYSYCVGLCFAVSYMVRLAKLLPQSVDSEQVGKDVEELANKSSKGPGRSIREILRKVLGRARRGDVLPPAIYSPSTNLPSTFAETTGNGEWDQGGSLDQMDTATWLDDLSSLLVSNDPALGNAFTIPFPGMGGGDQGSALQQTFAPSMQDQLLYTDSWAAWMAGSRNNNAGGA